MSDTNQPPAEMTKADQDAELTARVEKILGPALVEGLKPFTEKQASAMDELMVKMAAQRVNAPPKPDSEKGLMFARQARAMALGKGDPERAKFEVKRAWGESDPVLKGLDETIRIKNLSVSSAESAGNIVIPEYSQEWIDLLRNRAVVRSFARTMPMGRGAITMRKQLSAGTAYYVGEAQNITKSDQTVGKFTLSYKKLAALTVVSNDLLRQAGPEADRFVRDDLLAIAALREDLAFLRGDGTEYTPRGILNWTDATHKSNQTATTLAGYDADLALMIRSLEQANIPLTEQNGVFIGAPRTKWGLYKLAAGTDTGVRPYRTWVENGRLMGYRALTTNQVPITVGGSSSELYFVHADSCIIGDSMNVQLDVFNNGAYHDGSVVVSGISTDETVIRLLSEHDFGMRYDKAAYVLQAVTVS